MVNGKPVITADDIDKLGRHRITVQANGIKHTDRFDVAENAKRRKWREATIDKLGLGDDAHEFLEAEIFRVSEQAEKSHYKPVPKFTFAELKKAHPTLHPPVIDGLVRQGETCNLIAASKVGKSWLAYVLLLCVATGKRWLDRFNTTKGRVLLIDNELHPPTIANRIPAVGQALELFESEYSDVLDIWPLRGNLRSLNELHAEFDDIDHGYYRLIVFDARYRFSSEIESENDNAATTRFYNTLDRLAEQTGAALVLIHHSSKGSQTDKNVVDVGAGAGAQARAADCHLVLRDHEEEGVAVLDGAVRSFKPVEPIAVRWQFPLWVPDHNADATKLRGRLTAQEQKQRERDKEGMGSIIDALRKQSSTASKLRSAAGISRDRLERLLGMLIADGQIQAKEVTIKGNPTSEYFIPEDTDSGTLSVAIDNVTDNVL